MVDKISDAIDIKYYSLCGFIDLCKAFDILDHNILLGKLECYGIRGTALMWFKSYLHNRSQFAVYNGHNSIKLPVACGVPQGSILGPLIFLIYINDIANVKDILQPILFADDTYLFTFHRFLKIMVKLVHRELELTNTYLNLINSH